VIVHVDEEGTCSLRAADVFDSLKAERAGPPYPGGALPDCGKWDGTASYLWIDTDWLRSALADDEATRQRLDAMLAYAGRKGWIDAAGRVRAHVEEG